MIDLVLVVSCKSEPPPLKSTSHFLIEEITLIKENIDKSKEYIVKTSLKSDKTDMRKLIFSTCAQKDITILEMKKIEASLEDAFIKLIEDRPEFSQKEQRKNKKQAIKEEKARKKAEKEAKKEVKKAEKEAKKVKKDEGGVE